MFWVSSYFLAPRQISALILKTLGERSVVAEHKERIKIIFTYRHIYPAISNVHLSLRGIVFNHVSRRNDNSLHKRCYTFVIIPKSLLMS